MNDSPDENYNGNTALECVAELYCKDKSIERKNCCEILIKHTLEKNPNIEMPVSIKSNKELTEYWNACKANSEEWEFAIPKTATQVLSVQKTNKRFCPIK